MLIRLALFLIMGLGLAGFGTVAWISTRPPATARASEAVPVTVSVLAVSRPVHAGTLLKPDDLVEKKVAGTQAPAGATVDTPAERGALIGAMVRRGMAQGQVILAADVLRPGDHGFLSAVLGPGLRAVTVGVDAISGSAGLIWPGDRVDVVLTQSIEAPSLPLGRRVAAETVLGNVRVIAIDQHLVQGTGPDNAGNANARTVTLEVTGEQVERVAVATRLGRLSLSVRSADPAPARESAAGTSITWASDVSPALGEPHAPNQPNVIRVYQGATDGKEFRF